MKTAGRNLIIGVGNTLLGDDAVGIHIIRKMKEDNIFPGVEYLDMGTSSMELGYYIDEGVEKMVIIDSIRSDSEEPGTIFRLKPEDLVSKGKQGFSLHQLKLIDTLKLISIEKDFPRTIIIGIVPHDVETFTDQLSPPLQKAFAGIYGRVVKVVRGFLEDQKADP